MKNILHSIVRILREMKGLNIIRTVGLNFKLLPIREAIKFPFFVYGKLKIHSIIGETLIDAPIKTGMIKIGFRKVDLLPVSYLPSQILNTGKLIFKGPSIISGGVFLSASGGTLVIGSCTIIGGGTLIKATKSITIGMNTRIAYSTTIFDSNVHYVKNIQTGVINRNNGVIVIGKNCWISAGAYIGKGAVIPDFSILARKAFVSSDFSSHGENLFLVGTPAQVKSSSVQRIFSMEEERLLNSFFEQNPNINEYKSEPGLYEDNNDLFEKYL